ncbi:MAG TPA: hypothetical protein VK029_03195 [Pseudogracilibacillus sp.]|nr:hypothetical protein [Pseudogracilibacillus sp.]
MGYILPVTHYTYQQYHRRINKRTKSPHAIDATPKVTFHMINDSYEFHAKNVMYNNIGRKVHDGEEEKKRSVDYPEKKGLTINETI